ncbi:MAG: universal stress protein [Clostridia bacterium]|nr:universal stress protein [Clostridia bacterium]
MSPNITPLGAFLALLFTVAMGSLIWWMLHAPPPVPLEVARATLGVESLRRILVPTIDTDYSRRAVELASRLGQEQKAEIILVYVLEVPMTLPLGAHMPEQEAKATEVLKRAQAIAHHHGLPSKVRLVRSRHAGSGILQAVQDERADIVVIGMRPVLVGSDSLGRTSEWLIKKCSCELVIDKLPG